MEQRYDLLDLDVRGVRQAWLLLRSPEGKGMVVMEAEFNFEPGITAPEDDEQFERFWELFIEESQADNPIELAERETLRAHIAEQHGHALNLMDLFWRSATEAVNWGSEILHEHLEDDPEDDAYAALFTTVTGLAARALLALVLLQSGGGVAVAVE